MHILVLGAGVVGTTSAWFLRQQGHTVTVIDRQSCAGAETSYANGGQISVSHAEPWANPGAPWKVLRWLLREDAPLLFRVRADLNQWRWGLHFLLECLPARTRRNIRQIVNLGLYSRATLQRLRADTGIQYDCLTRGILHFYTSRAEFEAARGPAAVMNAHGCDVRLIGPDEVVAIEPALRDARHRLAGGSVTTTDESGDANLFTRHLAELAAQAGVTFGYDTTVVGFEEARGRVAGVRVKRPDGGYGVERADAYVAALGSYSPLLLKPLGYQLDIYPAKGYSATVPVANPDKAYTVSLTDDEYKLVYSRLGERLRIAGTAELNGYGLDLNPVRCAAIVRRARELFPEAGDWDAASFWTGLRPATPSNVPYIGRAPRHSNLYFNTGHGTLGWTHSCGSARALADIVSGAKPEVDFEFVKS
jgi:D-amino-acid dehydrogenase